MITQSTTNHRSIEHLRIDDVQEDKINAHKLNATAIEQRLVSINIGTKRRIRNNHAQRLAKYLAK